MAPAASDSKPMYTKDERALCFHGELLYEAKVLEIRKQDPKDKTSPYEYRVHYKGWKNTWDDWVLQDRLRKFTEDNKELAANLKRELIQQSQPKSAVKPVQSRSQKQGSDLGSGRGSEERHSSVPAGARGTKRGRDNDIEKVTSSKTTTSARSSKRRSTRSNRARPASELTLDELLTYSPSPEPEYMSLGAEGSGIVSWAPLLSGTTQNQKAATEQEPVQQGKRKRAPLKAHPAYLKAVANEPGNFAKHLFYQGLDPKSKTPSIAGVGPDPLELDPPGAGGPFDALKFPDRLVQQLNRNDGWTISDWGSDALNKIPANLMSQIKPEILAQLPGKVIRRQQADVRKKLQQYRSSTTPAKAFPLTNETSSTPKLSNDAKFLEATMPRTGGRFLRQSQHLTTGATSKPMKPKPEAKPEPPSRRDGARPNPPAHIIPPAMDTEKKEDNFVSRPSIRITIPDHLKNILVDDWENVTKSLLLVPLPSRAPANFIIDSYFEEEKLNRRLGTGDADILEEFCAGLKVYFDKSIGKILLYRFERGQLAEVRKLWESGRYPDWENRGPGDCYGAEHLTLNMPELIAQTNMDTQSVARLKEELSKFCVWLSRNSNKYFAAKYEKPSAEYIENAR
ncbi:hypothetical protein DV738_g367, partial [Chaetothyriales sp. CBS 135597]